MSNEDQTILTRVKALLVRRGVNLSDLGFGVTNGVVNFTGVLSSSHFASGGGDSDQAVQEAHLARWLDRQVKRVSGVRDVSFNLQNVRKDGVKFRKR